MSRSESAVRGMLLSSERLALATRQNFAGTERGNSVSSRSLRHTASGTRVLMCLIRLHRFAHRTKRVNSSITLLDQWQIADCDEDDA